MRDHILGTVARFQEHFCGKQSCFVCSCCVSRNTCLHVVWHVFLFTVKLRHLCAVVFMFTLLLRKRHPTHNGLGWVRYYTCYNVTGLVVPGASNVIGIQAAGGWQSMPGHQLSVRKPTTAFFHVLRRSCADVAKTSPQLWKWQYWLAHFETSATTFPDPSSPHSRLL